MRNNLNFPPYTTVQKNKKLYIFFIPESLSSPKRAVWFEKSSPWAKEENSPRNFLEELRRRSKSRRGRLRFKSWGFDSKKRAWVEAENENTIAGGKLSLIAVAAPSLAFNGQGEQPRPELRESRERKGRICRASDSLNWTLTNTQVPKDNS